MKNNIHEAAIELKKELDSSLLVKEYRRLKYEIEHDDELLDIADKLKKSAKLSNDKKAFLELKNAYETHPLIVNFKEIESELMDMLSMLKNIVEE